MIFNLQTRTAIRWRNVSKDVGQQTDGRITPPALNINQVRAFFRLGHTINLSKKHLQGGFTAETVFLIYTFLILPLRSDFVTYEEQWTNFYENVWQYPKWMVINTSIKCYHGFTTTSTSKYFVETNCLYNQEAIKIDNKW